MRCSKVRKHIEEIYGQGENFKDKAMLQHLGGCPACTGYYRQWLNLVTRLEQAPVPEPAGDLAYRVMRQIPANLAPAPVLRRPWFLQPLPSAIAAGCLLLAGGTVVFRGLQPQQTNQIAALEPAKRTVQFVCDFPDAKNVAIAGDFNQWDAKAVAMHKDASGKWVATVQLQPGAYQYQFIIDGSQFQPDPNNPIKIEDGFGGYNSGIEI
jgi:anti-sigma factor RsiW